MWTIAWGIVLGAILLCLLPFLAAGVFVVLWGIGKGCVWLLYHTLLITVAIVVWPFATVASLIRGTVGLVRGR